MTKISLGCGKNPQKDVIGLDIVDFGWNKVWDATKDKLPFEDNSVDAIEAHNFFEHVPRSHYRDLFNECHRVLKAKGSMVMTVPDAEVSLALAIQDITHVSFWCKGTFKYLTGERPRNADYGFKKWIMAVDSPKNYEKETRVIYAEMRPNKDN